MESWGKQVHTNLKCILKSTKYRTQNTLFLLSFCYLVGVNNYTKANMGAFLHIGLRARLSAQKRDSVEQMADLRQRIGDTIDLSVYDELETDDKLVWSVKPALLERELIPFLRKQFTLIPSDYATQEREEMLQELQSIKTVDELKNWCNNAESYISHWNDYDSLTIGEGRQRQHIPVEVFVFASAGKISMESSGGLFDYFESLITLSNPEFDLAKVACVSII